MKLEEAEKERERLEREEDLIQRGKKEKEEREKYYRDHEIIQEKKEVLTAEEIENEEKLRMEREQEEKKTKRK